MRIFNKSGCAIAAQWSGDSGAWVEIGEVTGQGGSSDGGEVLGVLYDHVMPVEIDSAQGVVTLQLGYNELENPFVAAQRFLDQNQMDQNYLSQIADFITARAGKNSAPTFDMSHPSSSSSSGHAMDVVTGDDSSSGSKRPRHNYTLLPMQTYFTYEDIPPGLQSKFMAKIRDFNSAFAAAGAEPRGVLAEADLLMLEDALAVLADTSHYHSSRAPKNTCAVLHIMLSHWTEGRTLFPAFDLLRMLAAHPSGSLLLASSPYLGAMLAKTALVVCQDFFGEERVATVPPPRLTDACSPASSPQALTALRFLATSCRHSALRQKVLALVLAPASEGPLACLSVLIGSLSSLSSSSCRKIKSGHRHALSSWCVNVVLACCAGEDVLSTHQIRAKVLGAYLPATMFIMQHEADSADVVVRGLLAVGSLAVSSSCLSDDDRRELQASCPVEAVLSALQERWTDKASDYVDLCLAEVAGAVYSQYR